MKSELKLNADSPKLLLAGVDDVDDVVDGDTRLCDVGRQNHLKQLEAFLTFI